MTQNKQRVVWVDMLKGFLILTVILGHAVQSVYMEKGEDFMSSYLWRLIYSFHMPAFMAVSGYLTFRQGKPSNIVKGTIRRFKQLVIPFMVWSVIMFFVNHNVTNIYDYILYPNKSYWFLWALFFISIIFNIITYLSFKLKIKEEVMIGLTSVCLIGLQLIFTNPKLLGFEYVSYYFLYYSIGYLFHKYICSLPTNILLLVALVIIWFVLGSYWQPKGIPEIIPEQLWGIPKLNILYRIFTAIVFIVMMFGVLLKYSKSLDNTKNNIVKWLAGLGAISLGIYTVHMVVRVWLVKGIVLLFPTANSFIHILLTFMILTIISIGLVKLMSKWNFSAFWLLGKINK